MKTKEQLINLGIAESKADEIMLLQDCMLERAVKFQFRKKDGSVRDAKGTLRFDLMKQPDGTLWTPGENPTPEPATIIRFFDVVKGMWRSFTCTEFITAEI